jgi:hypothetical protein
MPPAYTCALLYLACFLRWDLAKFLPGLISKQYPPYRHLSSGWDYMCVPLHLAVLYFPAFPLAPSASEESSAATAFLLPQLSELGAWLKQ